MKDKELIPVKKHYQSFFKLKETNYDNVKLPKFIHKGQSEMYDIMNKIESYAGLPSQDHTNVIKKFFHRLRGDRKGSIKNLKFDKLFNVDLEKYVRSKRKMFHQEIFKTKKHIDIKNNNTIAIIKPNLENNIKTHPIKLFKTGAEQLKKISSIISNKSDSNTSLLSIKQPLYITSQEFKSDENSEQKKSNNFSMSETFQSNKVLKSSIYDIRFRFDESLKNLEKTIYKKVKKPNRSLSITSDQGLLKQRMMRTSMINNITSVEIPKIEKLPQMFKKKFFSADYAQNEVDEIMKDIRMKGFYVTDRNKKKKYLSIDENHNAMTKDYYMNRISESSAMKFVNYVKNNYLTNTSKKYDIDNLSTIIKKQDIKSINIKNNRLFNLNRDLDLRYRKLVES